jgi:hypothetical protein
VNSPQNNYHGNYLIIFHALSNTTDQTLFQQNLILHVFFNPVKANIRKKENIYENLIIKVILKGHQLLHDKSGASHYCEQ